MRRKLILPRIKDILAWELQNLEQNYVRYFIKVTQTRKFGLSGHWTILIQCRDRRIQLIIIINNIIIVLYIILIIKSVLIGKILRYSNCRTTDTNLIEYVHSVLNTYVNSNDFILKKSKLIIWKVAFIEQSECVKCCRSAWTSVDEEHRNKSIYVIWYNMK